MTAFKATLLAAAIALTLGACASTDDNQGAPRTLGETVDDASITAAVKAALLADVRTKGFDINVNTSMNVVTLRGGADNHVAKQAATDVAMSATGVRRVDNQLVVASEGSEARQDANTATASGDVREALDESGDGIDDAWITSKVKSQLLADELVKGMDVTVETKGNVVTLSGVVSSAAARDQAISLARGTKGVRGVLTGQLHVKN